MPGDEDSPIPDAPPDNSEGEIVSEAESEEMDKTGAPSSKRSKPGNIPPPSSSVTQNNTDDFPTLVPPTVKRVAVDQPEDDKEKQSARQRCWCFLSRALFFTHNTIPCL